MRWGTSPRPTGDLATPYGIGTLRRWPPSLMRSMAMRNLLLLSILVAVAACTRAPSAAPTGAASAPKDVPQPVLSTTSGRIGGVVEGFDRGTVALVGGERFSLSPD